MTQRIDNLTHTFTKSVIRDALDSEVEKARETGGAVGFVLFDIDYFKRANTEHGDEAGDRILCLMAETLKTEASDGTKIGRYGGEEFCVLLPGAELEQAFLEAERMRQAVERRGFDVRVGNQEMTISVTISGGVAAYPRDGRLPDEIMREADTALSLAKRTGRNRVCLPSDSKDPLTGLYSREAIRGILVDEIRKTKSKDGAVSFALLDLDDCKALNERYGHREGGDEVLKRIAETCRSQLPSNVAVGRYSGEAFCAVLPDTEIEEAFLIVERVRATIESTPVTLQDNGRDVQVSMTVSAGVASFPKDGPNAGEITRKADTGLYRAQTTGKNRVCLPVEERMVTKTTHYTTTELERLAHLAEHEGVGEAFLLREALDDLLLKYESK